MIQKGDWVTQYSAGYWLVLEVIPKYADEDYDYNGTSWKKGDRLGDWAILKKGFTPKMKPGNACELADARWCTPVPEETRNAIEAAFAENPKAKQKFDSAPNLPRPSVASAWLKMTDAQAGALEALLGTLPDRFTEKQLWAHLAAYEPLIARPDEATHVLYTFSHLWEISGDFEPLQFGPVLKRYDEMPGV